MKSARFITLARPVALAALLGAISLTACGGERSASKDDSKDEPKSMLGSVVSEAVTEARKEIREGNITISKDSGQPKAEISPQGDFLIKGKPVNVDPQQRALLLEYRGHVAAIAEAGMEIGVQGADLAAKAMGEAMKGIFSGKSEKEIEKSVEAEASKIKTAAAQLCGRLPAMLASQQKLAAALPEFRPYATMTQSDVDDCGKDGHFDIDTAGAMDAADEAAAAAQDAADAAKDAADAAKDAADAAKDAADAVKN